MVVLVADPVPHTRIVPLLHRVEEIWCFGPPLSSDDRGSDNLDLLIARCSNRCGMKSNENTTEP